MGLDPAHEVVSRIWQIEKPEVPKNMAVVDCHTHTYFSGDSNTSISQFAENFETSGLTHAFVTDHQSVSAFPLLQERLGQRVICGQEQRVREGEIIGLFISEKIPPGLRLSEASNAIRGQGGIVYACHPMDEKRFSLGQRDLVTSLENGWIDAIELCNSKSASINPEIREIAERFGIPLLGGSDSHVATAIGSSGAVMPWFSSSQTFLRAAANAVPFGRYCDPRNSWPLPIVPTTSD